MTDDFVRDLEDELVAAARFRAAHPARRLALPRRPPRGIVVHAMFAGAAAALAIAAVLALVHAGDGERTTGAPLPQGETCAQVAPDLRQRVTALYEPAQPGVRPPHAAIAAIEEWDEIGAIALDGARRWGGDSGVDFWVVPVTRDAGDCAPATEACVVGVAGANADAICSRGPEPGAVQWRFSPLPGGRSAIFGFVPDRATAVDVQVGDRAADVEARLNVFGGVLPFPVRADSGPEPEAVLERITGTPSVGVVDGGGDADTVAYRLGEAGYATTGVTPGVTPQDPTTVYWRPGKVSREDVARVAALSGATQREEMGDRARVPRPVQDAGAPVVVVVGSG